MKKLACLLLLCLAALPAAAQEFMVADDVLRYYARPFRDRTERFQSARVEALQMRLAVDDESDKLTFENWADNRADIRSGDMQFKFGANTTGGESYSGGNKWEDSGNELGAWGRYGRLEFEGTFVAQKSEKVSTQTRSEYNKAGGGAALSFGSEELSFGAHLNINKSGDEDWESVTDNSSAGLAAVLRSDLWELGATADFVTRGTREDSISYDVPRQGPQFGAQAMLMPVKGLKAALRGSLAKITAQDAHLGGTKWQDYKADHRELGARLEWKLEKLPLTFGLEYASMFYDPNYTASGVFKKAETDVTLKTAGAALRLLEGRLLLGLEAQDFVYEYTSTNGTTVTPSENEAQTVTAGAELWLLPGFAVRASYQKMRTDDGTDETDGNCMAAGAGFKGEKFYADLSLRKSVSDEDAADADEYTDVRATVGFRF